MSSEQIPVRPGQVWADNDPRVTGRTIRIDAVDGDVATCTVLTNDAESQAKIDTHGSPGKSGRYMGGTWVPGDRRGTTTRVKLARLRPVASGYRLLEDTDA